MKKLIYILSCLYICLLISGQVKAQTCNSNFTVSTQIKNSTCLSNGEIKVTLVGDTTNIFNVQYGLSSTGGFTINPQSDNVLRNIPPGTYSLTVRAFCKIDSEYSVVKTVSSLVVGGNYKAPEVSFNADASRKSYEGCNTGIIALNVINGSGTFTFTITSAPAGVVVPAVVTPLKSGNTYTFPGNTYPAGNYTVKIDDGCYTAMKDFTLGTVYGIPYFTDETFASFRPDLDNTQGSCGYVKWNGSSNQMSGSSDYLRYYNDRMYEIGAAPAGQMPTNWTTWNSTSTGGVLLNISPYTIANFYTSNSMQIYTRLKGCTTAYRSFTTNIRKMTLFNNYIKDRNCNNYTYIIKPWSDYDGVLCYPLKLTVQKTSNSQVVYEKTNWLYTANQNDAVSLDYDTQYKITFTDQNGTEATTSIINTRNISFTTTKLNCADYQLAYYLPAGTNTCVPVNVTITDEFNNVICTDVLTNNTTRYSCPLVYGKPYNFKAVYSDGFEYKTTSNLASNLPTSYTLTTYSGYDDKCSVNRGGLYVTSNKSMPIGTTLTITGPAGYVSQKVTVTSSYTYYYMSTTNIPPGTYTLTADHGCGSPIVSTFNNPGIYDAKNFSYTTDLTCLGLRVTPTGTITYKGAPTATYYRLISGPTGYEKAAVTTGGSFIFSSPGTYKLGILTDNSSTACAIRDTTIVYTAPVFGFDPLVTTGYVCVDGNVGNISVKAINGVAPYKYELWNKNNTAKVGVADITSSGIATFTYGQADSTYTIRMSDQCNNMISQQITLSNLETAKVVYVSSDPTCTGSTIQLKCITLGNTTYNWTGPNGYTSNEQNPAITNAQTNMTGWYKVSVMPEFCGKNKVDSVYITVTPPLTTISGLSTQELSVCVREKIILDSQMTGGTGTYTYRWQSSTDGISWTNNGAATATYTPPVRTGSGTYYYQRITTDTACGTYNSVIQLNVTPCYIHVNPQLGGRVKK